MKIELNMDMDISITINGLELRSRYTANGDKRLEIVQWNGVGDDYSVAYWRGDNLQHVGNRPMEVDADYFMALVKIGYDIINRGVVLIDEQEKA